MTAAAVAALLVATGVTAPAVAVERPLAVLPADKLLALAPTVARGDMALVESNPDGTMKQVTLLLFVAAPPEVVPPLLGCLNSAQPELKVVAALTLGGLGNKSPQVISALEKCLEHDDIYVRSDALRLLRKLDPTREWNGHGE